MRCRDGPVGPEGGKLVAGDVVVLRHSTYLLRMALSDRITTENMLAYARAGIGLARAVQRLRSKGYESMIVPSRGAVPFTHIAQAYYREIVVPSMPHGDRTALGTSAQFGPLFQSLDVPFTADAGRLGVDGLTPAQIRRYWARVVASIVRRQVDEPSYRFFRFVRDEVCRVGDHDAMEWRMDSERLLFVDTVVSGQAVCEIVDAFNAEGMDQIHYLLLLDEDGRAMRPPYAARIRELEYTGRATLLRVPSLFTEDQGPAVSGIWSVVIPKLMDLAREEPGMKDGFVGAGLYYHEVRRREDDSNVRVTQAIARLHGLLRSAMFVVADPEHVLQDLRQLGTDLDDERALERLFEQPKIYAEWFDEQVAEYLKHLLRFQLFDRTSTYRTAFDRVKGGLDRLPAGIDVSSSHCIRVHLDEVEAQRLMKEFRASLNKPYWANAARTMRA